jgi:hypothetical protein
VDDEGREAGRRDVEENGRQGVQGQEHDDGGEDTGEGSADTSLGLDGRAREGASGRVAAEEGTKDVGKANGDELLGGVDDVVVDAAERLGDGDVFDQENQDGGRDVTGDGREDLGVDTRSANMLEA